MKWACVIFLFLASFAAAAPRNALKEGLLKLFTKWKNDDLSSLPFTLPSPRNVQIDDQSRYYKGYTLTLYNPVLKGLETLSVEQLSVSETDAGLTASLVIYVPELKLTADEYRVKARHWYMKWNNSHGTYFVSEIYNCRVTASVSFEGDDSNTVLQSLNLDYSYYNTESYRQLVSRSADANREPSDPIGHQPKSKSLNCTAILKCNADIHWSYLRNAGIFVSDNFDTYLQKYLNTEKYSIIYEATTTIKNKVNSVLRGYSPEQLKNIIRAI
ncbi:hypothetical protein MSG28_014579 [Choristoneura fumiferana]|uniref:Uncharacterized protein n=1 Tax=Choristoneura fumiferana TaxID=7141 RepID=A0ACC0JS80_CHOFU|nr:hypothetical protein MSG28_014579 [Choristoneura fumiferana]